MNMRQLYLHKVLFTNVGLILFQRGECDLAEYCTGDSGECPKDVFVQNTSPCQENAGYCNSGVCLTHEHQCHDLFGNNTKHASQKCYIYNKKKINKGDCGNVILNIWF